MFRRHVLCKFRCAKMLGIVPNTTHLSWVVFEITLSFVNQYSGITFAFAMESPLTKKNPVIFNYSKCFVFRHFNNQVIITEVKRNLITQLFLNFFYIHHKLWLFTAQ